MLKQQGAAIWTGDGKKDDLERDTVTCNHCNRVVIVSRSKVNIGFCRMCMDHVCLDCEAIGSCTPFEKKLEEIEAKDRLMRAL